MADRDDPTLIPVPNSLSWLRTLYYGSPAARYAGGFPVTVLGQVSRVFAEGVHMGLSIKIEPHTSPKFSASKFAYAYLFPHSLGGVVPNGVFGLPEERSIFLVAGLPFSESTRETSEQQLQLHEQFELLEEEIRTRVHTLSPELQHVQPSTGKPLLTTLDQYTSRLRDELEKARAREAAGNPFAATTVRQFEEAQRVLILSNNTGRLAPVEVGRQRVRTQLALDTLTPVLSSVGRAADPTSASSSGTSGTFAPIGVRAVMAYARASAKVAKGINKELVTEIADP